MCIRDRNELYAFKNHPFEVRDDEEMRAMVSSVKYKGVTQPAIVRPREDGGYEIVSGHRHQKASELAGYADMPCIVRNLTDDEAITQMVEDNLNPVSYTPLDVYKRQIYTWYTSDIHVVYTCFY